MLIFEKLEPMQGIKEETANLHQVALQITRRGLCGRPEVTFLSRKIQESCASVPGIGREPWIRSWEYMGCEPGFLFLTTKWL